MQEGMTDFVEDEDIVVCEGAKILHRQGEYVEMKSILVDGIFDMACRRGVGSMEATAT